jgi:enoyl reductase-like protein
MCGYNDTLIFNFTSKIDNQATLGLLGTENSLSYRIEEIEKHLHNNEYWYGNDGDNTMSRANNLTAWRLTAGSGEAYGTEVQLGAPNDFNENSAVKMDLHKIMVVNSNQVDTTYMIQFWYGTTTFANATLLTESPYRKGGGAAEAVHTAIMCPRISVASKIWARCKCAIDAGTLDLIIGLHGYVN